MIVRKIVNGELRAYIQLNGRWHHAYILSSMDQMTVTGEVVRMLNFRLTKKSKDILQAEKSKFHMKKPYAPTKKRGVAA